MKMSQNVFLHTTKASLIMVCVLLGATVSIGEEAGAYSRKSITWVDYLWPAAPSARKSPDKMRAAFLEALKQAVLIKRFDYNPVPEKLVTEFVSAGKTISVADSADSIYFARLSSIATTTLVPRIQSIIEQTQEQRGQQFLSEQQRNSFMSDKAKELGLTAEQLGRFSNSAYIIVPFLKNVSSERDENIWTLQADVGLLVWQVQQSDGAVEMVSVLNDITSVSSSVDVTQSHYQDGKEVSFQEEAIHRCASQMRLNARVMVQQVPAFLLTTQIVEKNAWSVGFERGSDDGIAIDDKFLLIEKLETMNGEVEEKRSGWVMVRAVAEASSQDYALSRASVVAGRPVLGMELREYPRIPIDITFSTVLLPVMYEASSGSGDVDLASAAPGLGAAFCGKYNFGPAIDLSQFYFTLAYALGYSSVNGKMSVGGQTQSLHSLWMMNAESTLEKQWLIRRFSLQAALGGFYQNSKLGGGSLLDDTRYRFSMWYVGIVADGGVGIALTPSIAIKITGGWQQAFLASPWTLQQKYYSSEDWSDYRQYESSEHPRILPSGPRGAFHFTVSPPSMDLSQLFK